MTGKDMDMERLLWIEMRSIEPNNACPKCGGIGKRAYPNTTTWRGGIGGQTVTVDICDKCWGSGDITWTWLNLRVITGACLCKPCTNFLRNELRKATMEEAKREAALVNEANCTGVIRSCPCPTCESVRADDRQDRYDKREKS